MKKLVLFFGLAFIAAPLFAGNSETVIFPEEDYNTCHAWACWYAERAAAAGGDIDAAYSRAYASCQNKQ